MIKLKTLLSEKFLGFGIGQGKVKEGFKDYLGYSDASATDPATGQLNTKQQELTLDQLKFDELTKIFPNHYNEVHFTRMQPDGQEGPYYRDALTFPTPSDASSVIGDMEALEDWKDKTKRRFGNVKVILDPDAEERWNMVKVEDDKFDQDRQQADRAKASAMKQWGTN